MIGRIDERERLLEAYNASEAQFVAVYGRRRVGKTFLVRETFNYNFTFSYTGVWKISSRKQIQNFYASMIGQGLKDSKTPRDWFEAFQCLVELINQSTDKKKVIFIDELPWMDSPRSKFVSALENFWNGWASARKDILLIACGSASSWIIHKLLKNKGGLHNRVTTRIHLHPFSLKECEEYTHSLGLTLSRHQIIEGYMVMGGIPLYWSKLKKSKSLAQNIDSIFLSDDGELRFEFAELYSSLFERPEKYMKIIHALGTKHIGLTREEIIKQTKLEDNGKLSDMIEDLIQCGFIRKYCSLGKKLKDAVYQLVDSYTLFYLSFIKDNPNIDKDYWQKITGRPIYNNWYGHAFEIVCLLHINKIKEALGISGILSNAYSLYAKPTLERPGAQIDLLIERSDNAIDILEMKYSSRPFTITQTYRDKLQNKIDSLAAYANPTKAIRLVMVTSCGLASNQYSSIASNTITEEELF